MKTIQCRITSLHFTLLLLAACSTVDSGRHSFRTVVIDGVPTAENRGGPGFDGELFRFEPVTTLRQDEEVPDSIIFPGTPSLRSIKGFFLDAGNRYYIYDSGGSRIAVFGPDGRYERSIGRRGQGPGEFMVGELLDLTDGILKIIDHNQHRISRIRTDGELIEIISGQERFQVGPDMFFTMQSHSRYDENGHLWLAPGFLTTTATGDTVGAAALPEIRIMYEFDTPGHGKGGKSRPAVPFTDRPCGLYLDDGSVLLTTGVDPSLTWYELDGSIRKRIELGIPRREVTRADRDRFFRDLNEQYQAADDNGKVYLGWMRDAVIFPEFRTLWNHITVDDAGYMWLEGSEMEFERIDRGGGCTYHLLSPEGEYLGTSRAPGVGRTTRGFFMGEVTEPETGLVEYAVWRLEPRAEGFLYPGG
ncbi:6-bladed beta-propeller [Gemmatimonadota bacterium]